MDGYRANGLEIQPSDQCSPGKDVDSQQLGASRGAGEDDIDHEPPPASVGQDERRMQVRAYNYWAGFLGDRPFPQIGDLAAAEKPDFAEYAVVLDFSQRTDNPAITMLGAKLAEECGTATTIKQLSDVPGRSLLSRITDHYMQILANKAPIGFEAEFVNHRGKTLLYRGILLPFSGDGEKIGHIMGVINWKELAAPEVTAELIRELDGAVEARHSPLSSPRRGAWADGPVATGPVGRDPEARLEPSMATELADWLAAARQSATAVDRLEDRSRSALYTAIGRAWDFALAAATDPKAMRVMVAAAGLVAQARAPMTPVAKLVFGAGYDKTRLAEISAALAHARRLGLERGMLAVFLSETPGGLKGVVRAERCLRRRERSTLPARRTAREKLADRLRELPNSALQDICPEGSEFGVVLIRRMPDGNPRLLGEFSDDFGMIESVAKKFIAHFGEQRM